MGYTKEQREAKKLAEIESNIKNKDSKVKTTVVKKNKMSIKNLPLSTSVLVRSNCFGQLVYESKKTGFQIEWNDTNTPQYLTLEELLVMRNTYRKFFEKNWIVIDGFVEPEYSEMFSVEDILDFLQVKRFYKNLLCPENIDDLFKMSADEIEKRIKASSSGSKDFIIIRANELIESRKLDSLTVINTLEKVLNCELSRPNM